MIHSYARASTDAEDPGNQVAQFKAAACATIFRETVSGATAEHRRLRQMMAALSARDVVVIPAVDRLSRDTTDFLAIARGQHMGRKSKLTAQQQAQARQRRAEGATLKELARS